jgi:hypothetical protein
LRVVSLLPSATEILSFVGAGDSLVGVTHECDHPKGVESLPKLTSTPIDHHALTSAEIDAAIGRHLTDTGSIYSLDAGLLEGLEPDLVLTQGLCDVCAVSSNVVDQAVARLPKKPRVLSMNPSSLTEMLEVVVEVGDEVGCGKEARKKVATLKRRLARVEEAVAGLSERPRVGCIEWLDPPFSSGHWVPEMVHLAGGEALHPPLLGGDQRSRARGLDPHALRLRCGAHLAGGPRLTQATGMERATGREEWTRMGGRRQLLLQSSGTTACGGGRDAGPHHPPKGLLRRAGGCGLLHAR